MDTTTTATAKRPRAPFKTADDFRALYAEEQRRIDRLKSQLLSAEERCNAYVGLANLCEQHTSTAKVSELQNGVEITFMGTDGLPKRGSEASIGRALEALLAVPGVQVPS